MSLLPNRNHLAGNPTEDQFRTAIGALLDTVATSPDYGGVQVIEIVNSVASGAEKGFIVVVPSGGAASANLDFLQNNILGTQRIFLAGSATNGVTVRHNISGAGKILTRDGLDVILTTGNQWMIFNWNPNNSAWEEIFRNFGLYLPSIAENTKAKNALGLGSAATINIGSASNEVSLNSSLGTAASKNIGTQATQIPLNSNLGALAYKTTVVNSDLPDSIAPAGAYTKVTINNKGIVTAGVLNSLASFYIDSAQTNGVNNSPVVDSLSNNISQINNLDSQFIYNNPRNLEIVFSNAFSNNKYNVVNSCETLEINKDNSNSDINNKIIVTEKTTTKCKIRIVSKMKPSSGGGSEYNTPANLFYGYFRLDFIP